MEGSEVVTGDAADRDGVRDGDTAMWQSSVGDGVADLSAGPRVYGPEVAEDIRRKRAALESDVAVLERRKDGLSLDLAQRGSRVSNDEQAHIRAQVNADPRFVVPSQLIVSFGENGKLAGESKADASSVIARLRREREWRGTVIQALGVGVASLRTVRVTGPREERVEGSPADDLRLASLQAAIRAERGPDLRDLTNAAAVELARVFDRECSFGELGTEELRRVVHRLQAEVAEQEGKVNAVELLVEEMKGKLLHRGDMDAERCESRILAARVENARVLEDLDGEVVALRKRLDVLAEPPPLPPRSALGAIMRERADLEKEVGQLREQERRVHADFSARNGRVADRIRRLQSRLRALQRSEAELMGLIESESGLSREVSALVARVDRKVADLRAASEVM